MLLFSGFAAGIIVVHSFTHRLPSHRLAQANQVFPFASRSARRDRLRPWNSSGIIIGATYSIVRIRRRLAWANVLIARHTHHRRERSRQLRCLVR